MRTRQFLNHRQRWKGAEPLIDEHAGRIRIRHFLAQALERVKRGYSAGPFDLRERCGDLHPDVMVFCKQELHH